MSAIRKADRQEQDNLSLDGLESLLAPDAAVAVAAGEDLESLRNEVKMLRAEIDMWINRCWQSDRQLIEQHRQAI